MTETENEYDLSIIPGDSESAARYLANARAFVAAQMPPPDYRQMAHSDDTRPVHDDSAKPAILDASYVYQRRHILSISTPDFIQHDETIYFPQGGGVEYRPGFSNLNLGASLRQYLVSHGVHLIPGKTKYGNDGVSRTDYIELDVIPEDYKKGRKLISEFVHGTSSLNPGVAVGEAGLMRRGPRMLGRLAKRGLTPG